jgi:hypothetical protein
LAAELCAARLAASAAACSARLRRSA